MIHEAGRRGRLVQSEANDDMIIWVSWDFEIIIPPLAVFK
jgi:hypothetical protein